MVRSSLTALKNAVLRGLAVSGVETLVRDSAWRRRRLLILCYHGLSLADEHLWSHLYVTPEHLARRLRLIRAEGYQVLPFGEALRKLFDGSLPDRSVAITFDDGFADFYLEGQPLLREFDVPATVYLTTYYVRDPRPVFDPALSYLLWKGQGRSIHLDGAVPRGTRIPRALHDRGHLHGTILSHARKHGWSAEEKDLTLRKVSDQIGFDLDELIAKRMFFLMSPDEVSCLDRELIDVQLHTHRHRTPRDQASFVREVTDNRAAIEALVPSRVEPLVHFCYPSGDYDRAFLPWLRELGIKSGTTCEAGLASAMHDPLLLPRLIDNMGVPEYLFRSWLTGTASFLARRPAAQAGR